MLKLKLNGVNDEILNAVSLLCEDYDFSLSDDGLNVDIKNVSGSDVAVTLKDNNATIIYDKTCHFFRALGLLIEGIKGGEEEESHGVGFKALLVQGGATSIDALSVGFTIADYGFVMALVCSLIIAVVTFFICVGGLQIGKTVGNKLSNKASILGGVILIFIGIEIFVTGVF